MKKLLLICGFSLLLSACASYQTEPLGLGKTPKAAKAVLVGKIELSPAVNRKGNPAKAGDTEFQETAVAFRPADQAKRSPDKNNWDDKTDVDYSPIETNKFFAIEVTPQENIAAEGMSFYIERESFFSADKYYNSHVNTPRLVILETLKAGEVYYIGTVKITLHDKSYKAAGDQIYDKTDLQHIVPASITVKDEYDAAVSWFKKAFPNVKSQIKNPRTKFEETGKKNKFTETTVS